MAVFAATVVGRVINRPFTVPVPVVDRVGAFTFVTSFELFPRTVTALSNVTVEPVKPVI